VGQSFGRDPLALVLIMLAAAAVFFVIGVRRFRYDL